MIFEAIFLSAERNILFEIYLLQFGFHPVTNVSKRVQKYERDIYIYIRRNYTQNNTKTQNTQNRKPT